MAKFGISSFRVAPDDLIDLTYDEYSGIVAAKNALVTMIGVEQKFDLLLQNYADYERELLNISLHQAVYRDLDWRGIQGDIAIITRRLSNLLSAARLYVDQIAQDLHDAFGSQHQVSNEIKVKLSTEYDARLGYRVMEAVRNMMQHRSLPIHRLSYPQDSQPGGARFRTVPSMEVARLKEADLKGSLVQELDSMGKHVPVTPFVRDYVEGLATVHEGLRTASESQLASWDSTIADVQARGVARWGGENDRAFLAVHLDESDEVVASVQVFNELTEYRRVLESKNSVLRNLARRFVSGECDQDA